MAKSIQGYINPSRAEYAKRIVGPLREKPAGGQWDRQKRDVSAEALWDEVEYVGPTPPSALSPRHIYSRMVSRQLSKRSSEQSLQARILNNMSPREMQSNQLLRAKPPIIRDQAKSGLLAELDSCGARGCAHVADSLAHEMDKVETYKPEMVAKQVARFLPSEAPPYQQRGLVAHKVHDVAKLRSLMRS